MFVAKKKVRVIIIVVVEVRKCQCSIFKKINREIYETMMTKCVWGC
jgi:hypothetical protein